MAQRRLCDRCGCRAQGRYHTVTLLCGRRLYFCAADRRSYQAGALIELRSMEIPMRAKALVPMMRKAVR